VKKSARRKDCEGVRTRGRGYRCAGSRVLLKFWHAKNLDDLKHGAKALAGVADARGAHFINIILHHFRVQALSYVSLCLALAPTRVGGYFSVLMGCKSAGLLRVSGNRPEARPRALRLRTKYYNAEIHRACFALPNFAEELVK